MDEEINVLELGVLANNRDVDVELDDFIIKLGTTMLLETLDETRLDEVLWLEDDSCVEAAVALELAEEVLRMLDEDFETRSWVLRRDLMDESYHI